MSIATLVSWLPDLTPLLAAANEAAEESSGPEESIIVAGVLLSLVTVYIASKVGGELCSRIDLPPVLGELVGGVVVGVSVVNILVFPEAGATAGDSLLIQVVERFSELTPESANAAFEAQSEVISVLAELGVIILLFEIGLESDLKELIRVGPQAAIVAVVGVVAPFVAGTAGLVYIFDVPQIPAIFAGAALTATSIGITAKVLSELNQLSSKEGQIIIGAAVLDDVLGIVVLAVVASLVKTGEVEVGNVLVLVVSAAAFLIGAIVLGRFISPLLVKLIEEMKTRGQLLLVSLIFAFTLAYIADAIQLEAILGAFAAGLILAETELRKELEEKIEPVADLLTPVFFVVVGARTDLGVLNPLEPSNREGLIVAAFLVVVAILGKTIAGFAITGKSDLNKLAIGVGMIPRGEVGLVFAGVGSASGALSESTDAAIIVMVIATTFVAPPLLRVVFTDKPEVETAPSLEPETATEEVGADR